MKEKTETKKERNMKQERTAKQNTEAQSGRVFEVTVTETLKRKLRVHETELKEATADDAEQTVRDWWQNGQIILVAEDFAGVEFEAREIAEGGGEDA